MTYLDLARKWKHNPKMFKIIFSNAVGKRKRTLSK